MLRPARWLERLAKSRRRLCAADRPAPLRQSLPQPGSPRPGSAITTRPNHPLPRQDFHLQACQRPKAAHRNLLFPRPAHMLSIARKGITQLIDCNVLTQSSCTSRLNREASAMIRNALYDILINPFPGGRAGPLLGFSVAKRVKSGTSISVDSGNCLKLLG